MQRGPAGEGGGGPHVACLNFKTSRVGVYKCLSLIVGFAITVAFWPREVVSCRDFILCPVTTFLGHVACQNLPWQGLCKELCCPVLGSLGSFAPLTQGADLRTIHPFLL